MKICLINNLYKLYSRGGAEKVVERLEAELQSLGHEVVIIATARPGQTLDKIQAVIDEELDKLRKEAPAAREMTRALNQTEASFYRNMERVGGFGGKADQLNAYYKAAGTPEELFALVASVNEG